MALTKEQRELKKRYIQELNAQEDVDKSMILESIVNYDIPNIIYENKTCLDLGTNIGSFAKIALERGAKMIYGVECDHRNYSIASNNFASELKVNIIHAAVSGSEEETLQIYKSNAKSNHSSTSIRKRIKTFMEYDLVKNYHIKKLLDHVQPEILKIDIEGAEYDIIESVIEYHPDVLFIELHGNNQNTKDAISRISAMYKNYNIDEIVVFKGIGGYDCLFYK